jgi:hypothetical protein
MEQNDPFIYGPCKMRPDAGFILSAVSIQQETGNRAFAPERTMASGAWKI